MNSKLPLHTPLFPPENFATHVSLPSSVIPSLELSLTMVNVRPSKATSSFLSLLKSPEMRKTRSSEVVAEAPCSLSSLKRQKSPSISAEPDENVPSASGPSSTNSFGLSRSLLSQLVYFMFLESNAVTTLSGSHRIKVSSSQAKPACRKAEDLT